MTLAMAKKIFDCAHCGNTTLPDVIKWVTHKETVSSNTDPNGAVEVAYYYALTRCHTCNAISLLRTSQLDKDPNDLKAAYRCYPTIVKAPTGLPEALAAEYAEALKIEKISKEAYAVMIGRVLERLCKDKNAKGERLYDQIKDLSKRGLIPEQLCEMAHALRFLRNAGAHVTDFQIEQDEVQSMKDFINTMLEYVYVAPAKLNALKASIEKKAAGAPKKKS